MTRKRKTVAHFVEPLSLCDRTSVAVERWFEDGAWHARVHTVDGAPGPEVTSQSGEAAWFLAAGRYFEEVIAETLARRSD